MVRQKRHKRLIAIKEVITTVVLLHLLDSRNHLSDQLRVSLGTPYCLQELLEYLRWCLIYDVNRVI